MLLSAPREVIGVITDVSRLVSDHSGRSQMIADIIRVIGWPRLNVQLGNTHPVEINIVVNCIAPGISFR
jgi:hypothetical protein